MKFLKRFLSFDADVDCVQKILTRQGFEVESVVQHNQNLNGVVVGYIATVQPHPQADSLQICTVDIGGTAPLQIVCGAKNARVGLWVAVARVGTLLPGNKLIGEAKIRGTESYGMLCSREELGLKIADGDPDGIWELARDFISINKGHLGKSVFELLDLQDTVLDVAVTPNRPDALSHFGIAREIFAGLKHAQLQVEWCAGDFKKFLSPLSTASEKSVTNSIQLKNLGRFTVQNQLSIPVFFLVFENIVVEPSPLWLRTLLECLGQRSVNSVVDLCNYILFAYGQPSHAFDLDKLKGSADNEKELLLRYACDKEFFLGLDGKQRQLTVDDVIVADAQGPQALLGILGGEHTKVDFATRNIVVEFANPDPVMVRHASRRHGRTTDSSFVFEKGIDVALRWQASSLLSQGLLFLNESNAEFCFSGVVSNLSESELSKQMQGQGLSKILVPFTDQHQIQMLGADIVPFSQQLGILEDLGFKVFASATASQVEVLVPSWRSADVKYCACLVEEVARVAGMDAIPLLPLCVVGESQKDDDHLNFLEECAFAAVNCGYWEVASFHFMREDDCIKLGGTDSSLFGAPLKLLNPIAADEPFLHTTLVPDLLRKVAHNVNFGEMRGQLFHSCRTFQNLDLYGNQVFSENSEMRKGNSQAVNSLSLFEYDSIHSLPYSREKEQKARPAETPRLAGVVFGSFQEKLWFNTQSVLWNISHLISHVVHIGEQVGVQVVWERICNTHPMFGAVYPGKSVQFFVKHLNGKMLPLGWAGFLSPKVLRNFEVTVPCAAWEVNLAVLKRSADVVSFVRRRVAPIKKFSLLRRDFAFLLPEKVPVGELQLSAIAVLQLFLKEHDIAVDVVEAKVFDIYRGEGIAAGFKSIALQTVLRPTERTFVDHEIQKMAEVLVSELGSRFEARQR